MEFDGLKIKCISNNDDYIHLLFTKKLKYMSFDNSIKNTISKDFNNDARRQNRNKC